MNHAIVVGGVPQLLTGRTFTKPDGSWLPIDALDNMSRAAKQAFGVYEVVQVRAGTGPILDSGPVYAVESDHVTATFTFRERDAQEAAEEVTERTTAYTNNDVAKVSYGMFLGLYAVAEQASPGLTPAQFSQFLDNAIASPAFTFQQYTNWVRERLE